MTLGRGLGLLTFKLLKSRRKIASRNLELCFPEKTAAERELLLQENAKQTGCDIFDCFHIDSVVKNTTIHRSICSKVVNVFFS